MIGAGGAAAPIKQKLPCAAGDAVLISASSTAQAAGVAGFTGFGISNNLKIFPIDAGGLALAIKHSFSNISAAGAEIRFINAGFALRKITALTFPFIQRVTILCGFSAGGFAFPIGHSGPFRRRAEINALVISSIKVQIFASGAGEAVNGSRCACHAVGVTCFANVVIGRVYVLRSSCAT